MSNLPVRSRSPSSSAKRIKLEDHTSITLDSATITLAENDSLHEDENGVDDSENNCSICLQEVVDRTVIPKCSHEFCFECLLVWTEQSRRCPLCSQTIGEYLIHSIRSRYDYRKHYLPPLRTSPPPSRPSQSNLILQNTRQRARIRRRERVWGTRVREEDEESDKLERSIVKRRWIYQHDLYAKHVASNAFTKYRPYPTPAQFSASQELISRTTTFLRRELQIWEGLDVEFLTTLIISLMKAIDIRSESAVKLISEFLDMDELYTPGGRHVNAEHFAHEVYSYVRSPYKDLFVYDSMVQYDNPTDVPPPPDLEQSRRWHHPSHAPGKSSPSPHRRRRRQERSRSRSSERSPSWSPSGRRYSPPPRDITMAYPLERPEGRNDKDISLQDFDSATRRHRSGPDESKATCSSKVSTGFIVSNARPDYFPPRTQKRDAKGKQKADINTSSSVEDFSKTNLSSADARRRDRDHTPPVDVHLLQNKADQISVRRNASTSAPVSRVMKAPRNRSLLDSVKAHLAGNVNSACLSPPEMTKDGHAHDPSVTLPSRPAGSPPSLLARLSELDPPSFATTPPSSQVSSGLTTPSPASASSSKADITSQDQDLVLVVNTSSSSSQRPEDAPLNSMEARAKLMARLNREKRQARGSKRPDNGAATRSLAFSAGDPSLKDMPLHADVDPPPATTSSLEEEAKTREAKLRAQARLRVRLEAEKRLVNGGN